MEELLPKTDSHWPTPFTNTDVSRPLANLVPLPSRASFVSCAVCKHFYSAISLGFYHQDTTCLGSSCDKGECPSLFSPVPRVTLKKVTQLLSSHVQPSSSTALSVAWKPWGTIFKESRARREERPVRSMLNNISKITLLPTQNNRSDEEEGGPKWITPKKYAPSRFSKFIFRSCHQATLASF